jgi:hypothetical protein
MLSAISYLSRRLACRSLAQRRKSRDCGTKEDQRSVVCRLVVSSVRELLSHFLKLLAEHRSVQVIDGNACLAVVPRLRDEGGPATP